MAQDFVRFETNREWFNEFFKGLKQVFDRTANAFGSHLPDMDVGYFYPKANTRPSIPTYYVLGVGCDGFAVQVYAILDHTILAGHPYFRAEPSFVVVKHSRGDRYLWLKDYGLRVITRERVTETRADPTVEVGVVVRGFIEHDPPTQYCAYQVPLDHFEEGQSLDTSIDRMFVVPVRELCDLSIV